MLTLIVGPADRLQQLAPEHPIRALSPDFSTDAEPAPEALVHYDLVLHLGMDIHPERLTAYAGLTDKLVMVCSVSTALHEMVKQLNVPLKCNLFGMNALPTMLEPQVWEVSSWNTATRPLLENALQPIGLQCTWVQDEVGMLTPRVLAMILNEAWLMQDEGSASMADIDKAMRLGVNYPFGPFEWTERIGVENLLSVLEALQRNHGPEYVRISRGLRQQAPRLNQAKLAGVQ